VFAETAVASGDAKKVDKKVVLGHLNEMAAVLNVAKDGLKGWQHVDNVKALLTFKGVVITVAHLGLIIHGLLLVGTFFESLSSCFDEFLVG